MKRVLVDTETNSLKPGNLVQISYIILGDDNQPEQARNFFFTVDTMDVDTQKIHGFSLECLNKLSGGKRFVDFLPEIKKDIEGSLFIAHNVQFDYSFLSAECSRANNMIYPAKFFCTMKYMTWIMKLPKLDKHNYNGSYKYPRFTEMASYLNVEETEAKNKTAELFGVKAGSHDARFDVSWLYLCYLNLFPYLANDKAE
jgi:DNA polymerase III epsilon subunit-like protein